MRGSLAATRNGFRAIGFALLLTLSIATASSLAASSQVGGEKLAKVGSLSVSSFHRVASLAQELGVTLPAALSVDSLERQFPFIGHDGLDPDRPAGLVLFAGPQTDFTQGQDVVNVLPVKSAAAAMKAFFDAGGKSVEPGIVQLNGMFFHRTGAYLIFGGAEKAVAGVRESDVLDLYKGHTGTHRSSADELIVRARFDIAAYRQAAPQKVNNLVNALRAGMLLKGGNQAGQSLALSFIQATSHLDLGLVQSGEELALKIGLAPARVPAGGTFAKPGMPQEVIVRLDVGAPPLKVLPWLEGVVRDFGGQAPAGQSTPDDFVHNATDVLLAGQAVSIGAAPVDNFIVFYMVQQHVAGDPAVRFKQLAEQFNLFSAYGSDKSPKARLDYSQYSTDRGIRITRLRVMENDTCDFCIDAIRRGDTVYLAGSTDQGRFLASLIDLKPEGKFSGLANGSVSLGAALSIIEDAAGPRAIPKELAASLHQLLRGQSLTVSATGESDELVMGISARQDVIKGLVRTFYGMGK